MAYKLSISLTDDEKNFLKGVITRLNEKFPLAMLKRKRGHNLWEYNIDTEDITLVCSATDYESGKIYPRLDRDKIYAFRLKAYGSAKVFINVVTMLLTSREAIKRQNGQIEVTREMTTEEKVE